MKPPGRIPRRLLYLSLAISLAIQLHVVISVAITINEAAAAVMQLAAAAP
jgi:hypothetical protein